MATFDAIANHLMLVHYELMELLHYNHDTCNGIFKGRV